MLSAEFTADDGFELLHLRVLDVIRFDCQSGIEEALIMPVGLADNLGATQGNENLVLDFD